MKNMRKRVTLTAMKTTRKPIALAAMRIPGKGVIPTVAKSTKNPVNLTTMKIPGEPVLLAAVKSTRKPVTPGAAKSTGGIVALVALMLVVLMLAGCETVIDYKGPETEPKAVIYALLEPDRFISVTISESHSVFQIPWKPRQIRDATVRVYRDGKLLETLAYQGSDPADENAPVSPYSKYTSETNKPEYGHVYRIEVMIPGYPAAYGETELPAPVAVELADTTYSDIGYGNRRLTVKLRFRDPADGKNYYRLTAPSTRGNYYGDHGQPYDPEQKVYVRINDLSYGALGDPIISPTKEDDLLDIYPQNEYYIFTDDLIPGKEYTLNLEYNGFHFSTEHYEFLRAFFRLNSITRDLYLYLQSYSAYNRTADNPFAEPVPVYSNITNGLGIVGALSFSQDSLIIGEYPVEGVQYEMQLY
ncbi:MAG TPA: DUF4249 domain-containing protein [Bacteroidales bacterium]|nr:DUF4249 domain-containing protein [Bacteroidales bacterium]